MASMADTPEAKARRLIDETLTAAGWQVQHRREMNIAAGVGVAIPEFPLSTGFADYLLYASGKVIGVIEAKPEGHTLRGVETQSAKHIGGLPNGLPRWSPDGTALPFAHESTGTVTQFTSNLDPDPRSREVFAFHRPEELVRLAQLDHQLRDNLQHMPPLDISKLWDKQVTAIENLERSLAAGQPRHGVHPRAGGTRRRKRRLRRVPYPSRRSARGGHFTSYRRTRGPTSRAPARLAKKAKRVGASGILYR